MKKLNVKKLNQFYMSLSNSSELKVLVEHSVHNFVHEETKNVQCIAILTDLGLLLEA